ncbi:MAG: class I SAM-dependent methyltransferase [Muribaculaceae bacterium]|nr:class I SAM-dependent methyltransferase [Muribaculaceae bacterium]
MDMNTTLNDDFFDWVEAHINDDLAALRLKYAGKSGPLDYAEAITQIECRRRFGKKLADTLAAFPRFYFPSVLAGEQSTADVVASFHASLVAEGLPAADLTAGLGIDALHAATRASSVTAIERDKPKVEALRYNARGMHVADSVEAIEGDCTDFTDKCLADGRRFATVFIDPARRAADGSRVFALSDCEPQVTAMMPKLSRICDLLIIKASPMLDIAHTIAEVTPPPMAVMAVGTATECKELLIMVNFAHQASDTPTLIEAVTLGAHRQAEIFSFTAAQELNAPQPPVCDTLTEGCYIYEPSPALMKTGALRLVASRWNLRIFHPNTRLLTSHEYVEGFHGTAYRVTKVLPWASKVLKRFAREYPRINVTVRNFGMSADALRAKLGVRDGGSQQLFGFTDSHGNRVLAVTEKV